MTPRRRGGLTAVAVAVPPRLHERELALCKEEVTPQPPVDRREYSDSGYTDSQTQGREGVVGMVYTDCGNRDCAGFVNLESPLVDSLHNLEQ